MILINIQNYTNKKYIYFFVYTIYISSSIASKRTKFNIEKESQNKKVYKSFIAVFRVSIHHQARITNKL